MIGMHIIVLPAASKPNQFTFKPEVIGPHPVVQLSHELVLAGVEVAAVGGLVDLCNALPLRIEHVVSRNATDVAAAHAIEGVVSVRPVIF
ncbi:hypothetical protein [Stenotrophomonas maltophilia]|uniref:hypothetical protein n=1 Tax=Stenotrophomonas maltophilia TaxID=40324 RepID=UPI0034DB7AE0